jgi:predicted AAA+ superfamily ATPase
MIKREAEKKLKELAKGFPVVAITGPRQSGKTTLARASFGAKTYLNLEDPDVLEIANNDPRGFLEQYDDGAIIDEAQRCPRLFSYLQVIVDEKKKMGQFILTGSQQFNLTEKITQSLAGRVAFLTLLPLSKKEIPVVAKKNSKKYEEILLKGGYPVFYDRSRQVTIASWFANYVTTYLERDVRSLLAVKDLNTFSRFVKMCAARNGQILNLSSLASDCGITHNTAKGWISIMEASYLIFLLYPYYKNFGKRLIKTPKLYFYDSGLVSYLLGIKNQDHLSIHPQKGAIFEGFIISEYLKSRYNQGLLSDIHYWRDNTGNEADMLIDNGLEIEVVEIKSGRTINSEYIKSLNKISNITKSPKATLIYGGSKSFKQNNLIIIPWDKAIKNF